MNTRDRMRIFAVFCIAMLLFPPSVIAPDEPQESPAESQVASAPEDTSETAGAAPAASTSVGSSKLPMCVGGDINKLAGGRGEGNNCLKYLDKFNKYAEETGLTQYGYDPLFVFITAAGESGCRSLAAGDAGAPVGGILQTTGKCKALDNPENPCKTVDDEIRLGMEELTDNVKKLADQGFSGKDIAWLVWIAYNRGYGTAKRAIAKMKEGMPTDKAIQEACFDEYGRLERRNKFCYEWIPEMYHCNGNKYDSICDGGRNCMAWSGCWVKSPYTTHYVEKDWVMYEKACNTIGGQMVAVGASITAAPEGAAAEAEAEAEEAGFKPTHPYFTVPYSINPSFSVSVPYDLSLYEVVPDYISRLERCRDDIGCIAGNVSIIEDERKDLNWVVSYGGNIVTRDKAGILEYPHWQAYCESPEDHAVNSISEAIDACALSQSKNCVCDYAIPVVRTEEISDWISESMRAGELESFTSSILGIMFMAGRELSGQNWDSRVISFAKQGGDIKVKLYSQIDVNGQALPIHSEARIVKDTDFKLVTSDWQDDNNPERLKYYVASSGASLKIFKDNNNNITIGGEDADFPSQQCELHNKMLKFCIIQNKSFLAYSEADNRMSMQQLVMKFAYLFKSTATDVKNFEVKDAKLATNTSLLVWDPLRGVDVDHYTIYYTDNLSMAANLKGVSPADLPPEWQAEIEKLPPIPLTVAEKTDADIAIADLSVPICNVSVDTCTVSYKVTTATGSQEPIPLDNDEGIFYYSRVDDKFFYFLSGLNNEQKYVFAITATDTNGAESPSFTQPEDAKHEDSKYDLYPALARINYPVIEGSDLIVPVSQVLANIDGSPLVPGEVTGFMLYCFDSMALDLSGGSVILSSKQPLSVIGQTMTDGTTRLVVPISDLDVCGFTQSPKVANIVVAATKGPTLYHTGAVDVGAFIRIALP